MAKYDIFISYRRDGGAQFARIIQLMLQQRGYKVFLDYDELTDGKFGDHIKAAISNAPIFMVVLSKDAMVRCLNENDWVRQEIELAISQNKKIVPVNPDNTFNGFPENMPEMIKEEISANQFSDISFGQTLGITIDYLIEKRIAPCIGKRDVGKVVDTNFDEARESLKRIDARNRYVKIVVTACVIVVIALVALTCVMFWQHSKNKEELSDMRAELEKNYADFGLQFSPAATMEQMKAVDRILSNMVEITQDSLWMSQFECSVDDWNGILGTEYEADVTEMPMTDITYGECQMVFLDSLRNLTNIYFDLPSVEEWQYAAQGGSRPDGTTYSGSNDVDVVAWYRENSEEKVHPSDGRQGKEPNNIDLFDMSGNVAEMCNTPYSSSGQWTVCGGSVRSSAEEVTVTSTSGFDADGKSPNVGFRLVIRNY